MSSDPVHDLGLPDYVPGSLSGDEVRVVRAHAALRLRRLNHVLTGRVSRAERARRLWELHNVVHAWARGLLSDPVEAARFARAQVVSFEDQVTKLRSKTHDDAKVYERIVRAASRIDYYGFDRARLPELPPVRDAADSASRSGGEEPGGQGWWPGLDLLDGVSSDPVHDLGLPDYAPGSLSGREVRVVRSHTALRLRRLNHALTGRVSRAERARRLWELHNVVHAWTRGLLSDPVEAARFARRAHNPPFEDRVTELRSKLHDDGKVYDRIVGDATKIDARFAIADLPELPPVREVVDRASGALEPDFNGWRPGPGLLDRGSSDPVHDLGLPDYVPGSLSGDEVRVVRSHAAARLRWLNHVLTGRDVSYAERARRLWGLHSVVRTWTLRLLSDPAEAAEFAQWANISPFEDRVAKLRDQMLDDAEIYRRIVGDATKIDARFAIADLLELPPVRDAADSASGDGGLEPGGDGWWPGPGLLDGVSSDPVHDVGLPDYVPGTLSGDEVKVVRAHATARLRLVNRALAGRGVSLAERAQRLWELRNVVHAWTRGLLADPVEAARFARRAHNPPFEDRLTELRDQMLDDAEVYRRIVGDATKIDARFAIEDLPELPPVREAADRASGALEPDFNGWRPGPGLLDGGSSDPVHDLGLPDYVPGRLSGREVKVVRAHAALRLRLLNDVLTGLVSRAERARRLWKLHNVVHAWTRGLLSDPAEFARFTRRAQMASFEDQVTKLRSKTHDDAAVYRRIVSDATHIDRGLDADDLPELPPVREAAGSASGDGRVEPSGGGWWAGPGLLDGVSSDPVHDLGLPDYVRGTLSGREVKVVRAHAALRLRRINHVLTGRGLSGADRARRLWGLRNVVHAWTLELLGDPVEFARFARQVQMASFEEQVTKFRDQGLGHAEVYERIVGAASRMGRGFDPARLPELPPVREAPDCAPSSQDPAEALGNSSAREEVANWTTEDELKVTSLGGLTKYTLDPPLGSDGVPTEPPITNYFGRGPWERVERSVPEDDDDRLARTAPTAHSSFGSWLAALRHNAGMTLEQLATASGVSKTYIREIENGFTPRRAIARKLLIALEVDPATLDRGLRKFYPPVDTTPANHTMGGWIAAHLHNMDLTQKQLATAVRLTRGHITNIVQGKSTPPLRTFRKVCDAFDIYGPRRIEAVRCYYSVRYPIAADPVEEALFWRLVDTEVGSLQETELRNLIYEGDGPQQDRRNDGEPETNPRWHGYKWIARHAVRRWNCPPDERDELEQRCAVAIVAAIGHHAPTSSFTAHAFASARGAIARAYWERRYPNLDARTRRIVVAVNAHLRRADPAVATPRAGEIAAALGLESADVTDALTILFQRTVSLDQPLMGRSSELHGYTADPTATTGFTDTEFTATVRSALAGLPDTATGLLIGHLVDGTPLEQAARQLGLSAATAAEIIATAIPRLRTAFRPPPPDGASRLAADDSEHAAADS